MKKLALIALLLCVSVVVGCGDNKGGGSTGSGGSSAPAAPTGSSS